MFNIYGCRWFNGDNNEDFTQQKKNKNNELKLGREIEPMASSHSLKR